jgi:PhnB protein
MRKVKPIPDEYQTVTPYLIVHDANAAIEFYGTALGATEIMRIPAPGGKVGHAELLIRDARIMLADEHPEMNVRSAKTLGGTPVHLLIYVEKVDEAFARALRAGGKQERPVQDQFYGDRSGTFIDPFGHRWTLATHVEDVAPEELDRRMAEMARQGQQG